MAAKRYMSGEIPNMITSPYYTLIETTRGSYLPVVVVNSALRTFAHRNNFPWRLSIQISCKTLAANGMPTAAERTILGELEDAISSHVLAAANWVAYYSPSGETVQFSGAKPHVEHFPQTQ